MGSFFAEHHFFDLSILSELRQKLRPAELVLNDRNHKRG